MLANLISTSCGLTVSFALNSRYTFQSGSSRRTPRQLLLFLLVTCSGLWILQPLIITGISAALGHSGSLAMAAFAKLCAIGVTLVWNYFWYATRVFRRQTASA